MNEIQDIIKKIEKARKEMNDLISEKGDLLDQEVIIASQKLDSVLNEYNKVLKQNMKK